MVRGLVCLMTFSALAAGCHPLPPGQLDWAPKGRGPAAEVYVVRGWRDLWSNGMDQLAGQITQAGIDADVYRESQWNALDQAIERRQRSDSPARALVLIGFSYGADDVLRIAHDLGHDGIAVDLLITIDPVTPPAVPGNVRRCYNYFQSNGIWDLFPWLRGIPLKASRRGQLVNADLRRDRRDLLEPNTSHATIAANPKLHREIVARVIEASSGPNAKPVPARGEPRRAG